MKLRSAGAAKLYCAYHVPSPFRPSKIDVGLPPPPLIGVTRRMGTLLKSLAPNVSRHTPGDTCVDLTIDADGLLCRVQLGLTAPVTSYTGPAEFCGPVWLQFSEVYPLGHMLVADVLMTLTLPPES